MTEVRWIGRYALAPIWADGHDTGLFTYTKLRELCECPEHALTSSIADGFTLALGGGGARGWAHIGVARALAQHGLRPRRIVGTIDGRHHRRRHGRRTQPRPAGGGGAAHIGLSAHAPPGRLALFDARALLERTVRELGDPRIEDLPVPLGITTYDLVAGRPRLITDGPLVDALEMSIAVPFFLPPRRRADGVWCDAGPWEGVPVTLARAWAPDLPVVGVLADIPKPAFLASPMGSAILLPGIGPAGVARCGPRLTARRYLSLLTARGPIRWWSSRRT